MEEGLGDWLALGVGVEVFDATAAVFPGFVIGAIWGLGDARVLLPAAFVVCAELFFAGVGVV
jgi:hypothetical protein